MAGPAIYRYAAVAAVALACLLSGISPVASASAPTAGILPPHNPAADCERSGVYPNFTLQNLDSCRAKEGLGKLILPSNWRTLTGAERLFVLADLERVNRGVEPLKGLSPTLDQLAVQGAKADNDPPFPGGGFDGGGGVWFGGGSAIAADDAWMYDDGPNGLDINADCPPSGSSMCWLHRDIILWKGTGGPLVAGGGAVGRSYSLEILSGFYAGNLTFTWAHELRFFKRKPGLERLGAAIEPITRKHHHKDRRAKKHRHRRHGAGSGGSGLTIILG